MRCSVRYHYPNRDFSVLFITFQSFTVFGFTPLFYLPPNHFLSLSSVILMVSSCVILLDGGRHWEPLALGHSGYFQFLLLGLMVQLASVFIQFFPSFCWLSSPAFTGTPETRGSNSSCLAFAAYFHVRCGRVTASRRYTFLGCSWCVCVCVCVTTSSALGVGVYFFFNIFTSYCHSL